MTPEDVTHLLGGENQPPQEPQAQVPPSQEQPPQEAPAAEQEEIVEIAGRSVPAGIARQFAEALGEDPEQFLNRAPLMYRYNSDMSRQGRENALLRQQLAQYQAAQITPMAPQQRPGAQAPPQQQQYDPASDPVNYLAHRFETRQEALERKFDAFIQAQQESVRMQQAEREEETYKAAYKTWSTKKKGEGYKNVPSFEEIDQLAADLELGMTRIPYETAFEVAWNVYFGDQVASTAQKTAVDKLRDPKAKIVVPGAQPAPRPQAAPNAADQLAGLTWGQAQEFIPETRR